MRLLTYNDNTISAASFKEKTDFVAAYTYTQPLQM